MGYALAAMNRRWSFVLLWIALALLPMRGVANVVMHLPAAGGETTAPPCHGPMGHPAATAAEPAPATDAADAAHPCAMCDLCHGASAVSSSRPVAAAFAPPRVAATTAPATEHQTQPSLRPPRG
jgi:hypothetical protein